MDVPTLTQNDVVTSGLVEGYVLGMAAPAWLVVKLEYFPDQAAHIANRGQAITLRIERARAIEFAKSILGLTTDPRTATFAQGTA